MYNIVSERAKRHQRNARGVFSRNLRSQRVEVSARRDGRNLRSCVGQKCCVQATEPLEDLLLLLRGSQIGIFAARESPWQLRSLRLVATPLNEKIQSATHTGRALRSDQLGHELKLNNQTDYLRFLRNVVFRRHTRLVSEKFQLMNLTKKRSITRVAYKGNTQEIQVIEKSRLFSHFRIIIKKFLKHF